MGNPVLKNLRKEKVRKKTFEYRKYLKGKKQLTSGGKLKTSSAIKRSGIAGEVFVKGLYLLKLKNEVVYVGMSTTNCMSRVLDHWNNPKKNFDSYTIISLPNVSDMQLREREKGLIRKLNPKMNVIHNQ